MKKIKLYTIATLVILFSACSDFGDIDDSPNGATTPLTSALLTNVLTGIGGTTAQVVPGLYCQYFSETLYTDASRYSIQDVNWGDLSGRLYDLQSIININTDPSTRAYAALQGSNENQIAIARIVKAYWFSYLTDRYGDMPYSEALLGNSQPKFDAQEDIYNDIFNELDEAVAQFEDGALVKGDIIFGTGTAANQVIKWKKFANSWRLILALRVSEVDATLGAAQANAALNADEGVFTSIADNVAIDYPGNAAAFNNPWYGIGADQTVSSTIANYLNSMADDRRLSFGNASGGTLTGMDYGLQRQDAIAYSSAHPSMSKVILADAFRAQAGTIYLLTYDQVALARAEAVELGWIAGGAAEAQTQYNNGIVASWTRWNQNSVANQNTYIARGDVDLTSGVGLSRLDKIRFQRWVSFYPNGAQGWSEWRRTNVPALTPSPAPVNNSGEIPVRYIYPTIEYGLNLTRVTEAVGLLDDGDTTDSHMWWDN